MGVYSEMDMEQFENDEMGPFQMDSHRPDAVDWHEQAGSRQQLPQAATIPASGSDAKPSGGGVATGPQSTSREDAGQKASEQEKLQQVAAMSDD